MKYVFLIVLTFASLEVFAKIEVVLGSVPLKQNQNLAVLPSVQSAEVIISRPQYVISYNKERRSPNWVAWELSADQLGTASRSNTFIQDSELEQYLAKDTSAPPAVTPEDYKGTCFDRGHQAPSADRTGSPGDNQSTFVMSNMLPQTPYLNRFLWEQLERQTRAYVTQQQDVKAYIITGPIYDENFGAIGPREDIPVPSKLFKVILFKNSKGQSKTISVVMPNILKTGDDPTNKETRCKDSASPARTLTDEWKQYQTSIPEIERLSGVRISP